MSNYLPKTPLFCIIYYDTTDRLSAWYDVSESVRIRTETNHAKSCILSIRTTTP